MPRPRASRPAPQDPLAKAPSASRPQSVRFNGVFEQRVRAAAAHEGVSVSEFIRQAVQERTDRVLGDTSLWDRIRPIVETISTTGEPSDTASRTHAAFAELVAEKHSARQRPWRVAPQE